MFAFSTTTQTQTAYTLSAAPSAGQAKNDKACGCTLTLTQQGIKGVAGCAKSVADCWR